MIKGKKVDDKRKERERDLSDKNRFEILLEDMRHEFKAVGEGHGILLHEIRENNKESKERDKQLEHMIKFSVRSLHEKIDKVEDGLNKKMDSVETRLTEKIDGVDKRLVNVEQKLDKVIERQDKQEVRQDKQEAKLDEVYHKVFAEEAGF